MARFVPRSLRGQTSESERLDAAAGPEATKEVATVDADAAVDAAATASRGRPSPRAKASDEASTDAASDEAPADDAEESADGSEDDRNVRAATGNRSPDRAPGRVTTRPKRAGDDATRPRRRVPAGRKVVAAPRAGSHRREKAALAVISRLRRLALNLGVWTVIFGLLAGTAWYLKYRGDQIDRAGRNATTAATAAAEAIFSYDYRAFDESVANGRDFVTGSFAREYAKTTSGLKETVRKERGVVKARVSVASVTVADTKRVEVLLFVNQYRRNVNIEGEKVDENRVLLTMQCVTDECAAGDWLVAGAAAI